MINLLSWSLHSVEDWRRCRRLTVEDWWLKTAGGRLKTADWRLKAAALLVKERLRRFLQGDWTKIRWRLDGEAFAVTGLRAVPPTYTTGWAGAAQRPVTAFANVCIILYLSAAQLHDPSLGQVTSVILLARYCSKTYKKGEHSVVW